MPDIPAYLDGILNGEFSADQRVLIARLMADYLAEYQPLPQEAFRTAARRCVEVICEIDYQMSQSRNPNRTWKEISIALQLPSACSSRLTQAAVGRSVGLSKMAISKRVKNFIRLADIKRL